jgi:hypothetical protein
MHILKKVPNSISIQRVANGFIVEMPKPYTPQLDGAEFGQALMSSVTPAFKEMMRLRDEDPLLAKLQQQEEDDPPVETEPLEAVGIDAYIHVFPTWEGMLDFLSKLVL